MLSGGRIPTDGRPPSVADVRQSIIRYLCEIGGFPESALTNSARFDQELEMRSIVFVEVQVALEEELDIEIDPFQIIDRNKLGDVIDYLHGLVLSRSIQGKSRGRLA